MWLEARSDTLLRGKKLLQVGTWRAIAAGKTSE
jgi:hypothetical protein